MSRQLLRLAARLPALLTFALLTLPALAQVTLVSQEARSGSGGWTVAPFDPSQNRDNPTTWSTNTNFTDVSDLGLHLKITRSGSLNVFRSAPTGTTLNASWTLSDFKVVFRVDQPTPFTVQNDGTWGTSAFPLYYPSASLSSQDATHIFPDVVGPGLPHQAKTGILQPGTYTFSGALGYEVTPQTAPPVQPFQPFIESGSFTAELTVGVPEPTCLPAMIAAAALLRRSRRLPT
jgi:hypothetical protein